MAAGPFACLKLALEQSAAKPEVVTLLRSLRLPSSPSESELRRTVYAGFLQPHAAFPVPDDVTTAYQRAAWFYSVVAAGPDPPCLVTVMQLVFRVQFVVMGGDEAAPPPLQFPCVLVVPVWPGYAVPMPFDGKAAFSPDACPPEVAAARARPGPVHDLGAYQHVQRCVSSAVSGALDAAVRATAPTSSSPQPTQPPSQPQPEPESDPDDDPDSGPTVDTVDGDGGCVQQAAAAGAIVRLQCGSTVAGVVESTLPDPVPTEFNPFCAALWWSTM
jgi:hypothetical protein